MITSSVYVWNDLFFIYRLSLWHFVICYCVTYLLCQCAIVWLGHGNTVLLMTVRLYKYVLPNMIIWPYLTLKVRSGSSTDHNVKGIYNEWCWPMTPSHIFEYLSAYIYICSKYIYYTHTGTLNTPRLYLCSKSIYYIHRGTFNTFNINISYRGDDYQGRWLSCQVVFLNN